MIAKILVAIIFLLVIFDSKITARRINEFGSCVEVNRGLRWLSQKTNPEVATILLLLAPNAFWCMLFYKLGLTWALGMLAGFKLRFWFNQLESLSFEKQAKAIKELINSSNKKD
jgi:hypothetical protein